MRSAWLIGAALLALGASAGRAGDDGIRFYGSAAERKQVDALHGQPAFEIEDVRWVQGGPRKIADLKGKVVLIDFWAIW